MRILYIILLIVVFSTIILAQPSFPNAPTQTPIGGSWWGHGDKKVYGQEKIVSESLQFYEE